MKHFDKHLVCAIALICSSSAFAAETASIAVTGEVTPSACVISASQTNLNFGTAKTNALGGIDARTSDAGNLNITCLNPTMVHFKLSTSGQTASFNKSKLAAYFTADGNPVSGTQLTVSTDDANVTLNGSTGRLVRKTPTLAWSQITDGFELGDTSYSVANTANISPEAIKTANIPLKAQLSSAESSALNWSKGPITANQTLTFELTYP